MEKLSVSKERVIEAANKCSTAKNILMVLFPEVFEVPKPKFKDGDWVTNIFYTYKIGCNNEGEKSCDRIWSLEQTNAASAAYRLATKEEIEKHLIALAEKKGFVKDVDFKELEDCKNGSHMRDSGKCGSSWKYDSEKDALYSWGYGSWCVYKQGQWAEIISEPVIVEITMDEIAKLKGCDVSQLKIKK